MNHFMIRLFLVFTIMLPALSASAQRKSNIVEVVDKLRYKWDQTAISLKDYQGIQNFCANEDDRQETLELLDDIHHWDTTLYYVVKEKYANSNDKEAAATLKDIELLETDYSTLKFKNFILAECDEIKVIRSEFDNKTIRQYQKEIKKFEKELVNYLTFITERIDIVDEHIHHLKLN